MESHAMQQVADGAGSTAMKVTAAMTQGGAGVAVVGGLTLSELAIVVGIAVSVLGLLGNWVIAWYWKAKRHELEVQRLEWDRRRALVPVDCERRGGEEDE